MPADLAEQAIAALVIDVYSVKPIVTAAHATGGILVVAEDHYSEGGLGDAVCATLAGTGVPHRIAHLAVTGLPGSASPDEQLDAAGMSAQHIAVATHRLLS